MTNTQIAAEYLSYVTELLSWINRNGLAREEAYQGTIAIDQITFSYEGEGITEFRLVFCDDLGELVLETGEDE